ncbi:MAG: hypothetical protein C0490_05140 [Marivirga sp.]|nr:hypothetical protein [Marivirga sp.]
MKIFSLLFTLLGSSILAQDFPRKEIDLNRIADELYGAQDLDMNYEELYENLVHLLSHPINLNTANAEDLRFLKILSENQVADLLDYRKKNTNLLSVYELQAVPGFDLETIGRLVPFVKVIDPTAQIDASLWKRVRYESDNYFLARYERTIQKKEGYSSRLEPSSRFQGSEDKFCLRFRTSRPGDFSAGFTLEKDAGEKITWDAGQRYYGVDFISFHAQLQNKGRLKNLVVGDYQSQFGQGIMLGGIFGTGKGGETITAVRRSNIGVLPYTSAYEAGNLRGAAATVEIINKIYITGYYSHTRRDANLSSDSLSDTSISSMQTTGLHRNENELSSRKRISNRDWGAVLQYKDNLLDAGLMFNIVEFENPVRRKATVYNQFTFQGTQNSNTGFYLNYTFQNISFFSEFSKSRKGGAGYSAGVLWSVVPSFDLALLYRNFDRDFYSFYSNAFAENSLTQNERGIYWGWKYRLSRKISLAGYVDLFQFPWLRYRSYSPSSGHEWLFRFSYQPSRKVLIFFQAREESKARNASGEKTNLYSVNQGIKQNYIIHCDYGLRQKLRLKTRVQFSSYLYNGRKTSGFAFIQDASADVGQLQFTGRYAVFATDDYDNRQYAYENDVLLAYSMPAYNGIGVRKVLMIEYKLNRYLSFWLRYGTIRYPYEEKTGTGPDTIEGNTRNDVKFQMRIKF